MRLRNCSIKSPSKKPKAEESASLKPLLFFGARNLSCGLKLLHNYSTNLDLPCMTDTPNALHSTRKISL